MRNDYLSQSLERICSRDVTGKKTSMDTQEEVSKLTAISLIEYRSL